MNDEVFGLAVSRIIQAVLLARASLEGFFGAPGFVKMTTPSRRQAVERLYAELWRQE